MAKLSSPRQIARYLELVAAGVRSGRRRVLDLKLSREMNELGEPSETIELRVTRLLSIKQIRARRRRR